MTSRSWRQSARCLVATTLAALLAGCGQGASVSSVPSSGATAAAVVPASSERPATPAPPSIPSSATPTPSPTPVAVRDGEPWIAFQRWTPETGGHLRLIRPDGTGDHEVLPTLDSEQWHPDWSPDGSGLAFVMDHSIWTVDVDGRDLRQVATCTSPCRDLDYPAWSPDGRSIAFSRVDLVDGQNPGSKVQSLDIASQKIRTLFLTVGAQYAAYPRWSEDGRSMVIELDRFPDTGNDTSNVMGSAIAIVDLEAKTPEPKVLTDWKMFASYPDRSRTDGRIVFTTYDLGTRDGGGFTDPTPPSDLYTMRPDGTNVVKLTHNVSGASLVRNRTASGPLSTQPTWTPDGSAIIFVQVDGEVWPGWTMATIRPDGSGAASATGTEALLGTHPRLRPTP